MKSAEALLDIFVPKTSVGLSFQLFFESAISFEAFALIHKISLPELELVSWYYVCSTCTYVMYYVQALTQVEEWR